MKNKKLIVLILTLILTIAIIAASSYAFFDLVVNNDNHVTSNITTKDLSLKFTDGPRVELTDVLPGTTIIKTFSVENTGTETLYYSIYLNDVINSFTRNSDLVYTLTSTNDGAVLDETELPKTSKALYQNIEIPVNTTQEYTLTVTYKNLNEDQNADMDKMFSGTIQLVAGVKTYNLTGYAYDNNGDLMNSGTVEVHSDVITAPIQSNGSFTLVNVPVGDHEILIKDNEETVVAEDTFKLDTKAETNKIENNDIKAKEEDKTLTISVNNKASDNVEIQILGDLNTVDLTINNGYTTSPVLTAYSGQKTNVVTINSEEHYHLKNITCDNDIEYTFENGNFYVASLTTSGTCTINYEIDTNTVTFVSNNTNYGTVATESSTIDYGTSTTTAITPTTGYHYESVTCTNGQTATYSDGIITASNITSATTCTVNFAINTYSVQLVVNNGSGATTKTVNHGTTTTFTSSPTTGYHYSSLTCTNNQTASLSGTTVTTGTITNNTVCTLNYVINTYTVTFNVTSGTGATSKTVNYGSTTSITSAPNSGYTINTYSCNNSVSLTKSSNTFTTGKITANTTCTITYKASCAYSAGKTWDYGYTGGMQSFTVPCAGTYKLEVWGAQGGNAASIVGGKGGYSSGNTSLSKNTVLYIGVGGQGSVMNLGCGSSCRNGDGSAGGAGYNGGGNAGVFWLSGCGSPNSGGGGASHIGKTNALLRNTSAANLYIVAGGGGGAGETTSGGAGGGTNGAAGDQTGIYEYYRGFGASQSAGGSSGQGPIGSYGAGGSHSTSCGPGGGGGYYGGQAGMYYAGAGGGSGYIGGVSGGSMSNGQRTGNGYARITLVSVS